MKLPELDKDKLTWAMEWLDAWDAVVYGLAKDEFSVEQLYLLIRVEIYYRDTRGYVLKKLFTRYWKLRGKALLSLLRKEAGL
jgi:hypothetical protein